MNKRLGVERVGLFLGERLPEQKRVERDDCVERTSGDERLGNRRGHAGHRREVGLGCGIRVHDALGFADLSERRRVDQHNGADDQRQKPRIHVRTPVMGTVPWLQRLSRRYRDCPVSRPGCLKV